MCPELLAQLDYGVMGVAYHDTGGDGGTKQSAKDAHQRAWVAQRAKYHHDHKDAFDKMYLKHYMAVAEARCGMVPSGSTKPIEAVHLVVKSGLSSSMLSQAHANDDLVAAEQYQKDYQNVTKAPGACTQYNDKCITPERKAHICDCCNKTWHHACAAAPALGDQATGEQCPCQYESEED